MRSFHVGFQRKFVWSSCERAGRFYYLSPTRQARLGAALGSRKLHSKARLGGPRGRDWGVVNDLEATSSLSEPVLYSPSHLHGSKTAPQG